MKNHLSSPPEEPIDALFEGSKEECIYVGSLPRHQVLNKIMYLDQLRFAREADNCHLVLHDHAADARSRAYLKALSKGASEEEQGKIQETFSQWKAWVTEQAAIQDPFLPGAILTMYLKQSGLHVCTNSTPCCVG